MKRKKYSDEFKAKAIADIPELGGVAAAAKKHGISSGLLSTWRGANGSAAAKSPDDGKALRRNVKHAIGTLRTIRGKAFDSGDPIHLTAGLALAILEGKM